MYKSNIGNKFGASFLAAILILTAMTTIFAFSAPAGANDNGCLPPTAEANGPYFGYTDDPITLDGSGSYDPDGVIVLYEWDFDGDGTYDWGSPSTGIVDHTYSTAGTYTAVLRVTDDCVPNGLTHTDTADVLIVQANPPLTESCGIDIALVIDSSGSITGPNLAIMKTAFIGFVDALMPSTPTQMSVTDFDDTATVLQTFTSDIDDIKAAINTSTSDGCTNWEDALIKAHSTFDPRADKPDLVIFASDGNPNTIVGGSACEYSDGDPIPVGAAVAAANAIKADGIRIITLGIGESIDAANLMAISSSDAYYDSDFGTLATTLAGIVGELCGGTVTVRKYVDDSPAANWEFTAYVTDGTPTPTSGYTDADGYIVFDIEIGEGVETAYVDIVETPKPGYNFVTAGAWDCTGAPVGTLSGASIIDIPVEKTCAIYCEFFNNEYSDDTGPNQTIELGYPRLEDVYDTGVELLDMIGSQTPVWINSSDNESGTEYIMYKWFISDIFGEWNDPPWIYVYDNQQTGDPFTTDTDPENGSISIKITFDESCFHQIHTHCVDNAGNWNYSTPIDFLVDADAPQNNEFEYLCPFILHQGGARYISDKTIKRIYANDTGCTGGVAGVEKIIWRLEDHQTQTLASGVIFDGDLVGHEDEHIVVSEDKETEDGKMIIEISVKEDCIHFIYHQAVDELDNHMDGRKQLVYVDTQPPEITKTHPDHGYIRINDTHGYLKANVSISLSAIDLPDTVCKSGLDEMYWRYEYDGNVYPAPGENGAVNGVDIAASLCCGDNTDFSDYWWYIYTDNISFNEECQHDLYYFAIDNLCNYEVHHQVYYVDDRAPYVDITYPDHGYYEGDVDYLKVGTEIKIDAYDNPDYNCQAGIESIFYRYEWDGQMFPSGYGTGVVHGLDLVSLYGEDYNVPSIANYFWYRIDEATVNISFDEECIHNLTFFAKDNVCHHSVLHNLTFYLDGADPETSVSYYGHGYYKDDDQIDHLKRGTSFKINAYDFPENDCAAGIESIFYRYEWNDSYFPSTAGTGIVAGTELVTAYGEDYNVPEITQYYWYRVDGTNETDVSFPEECEHEFAWFVKDNVCHRSEIQYEDYYVDGSAPEADITFPDVHGYYKDDNQLDHLKCGIYFEINAYDLPDNDCAAGIESIFYRYEWDGTSYPETPDPGCGIISGSDLVALYGQQYNIPDITDYVWYRINDSSTNIQFNENCTHEVFYFAKDNVCNRSEIYNHTIYVDCVGPNVWLEFPSHGYHQIDERSGYLKEDTNVTIKASDLPENDCAAGIEGIFWRYKYDGSHYPSDGGVPGSSLVTLYGEDYNIPEITQYHWFYEENDFVNISFQEDCNHTIYYFAKDNVCQRTDVYNHTFFVDDEEPEIDDFLPMVTHGVYVDGQDKYMKCGLAVTLSSIDFPENDCAAGIESIFYRYEWNDSYFPSTAGTGIVAGTELVTAYGEDYNIPEITQYYWYRVDDQNQVSVPFNEECEHNLTFFAKDNVCHRSDLDNVIVRVDCTGPEVEVEHPDHGYVEINDTAGYIKVGENINLTATDLPDNECASGIESIFYRYDFEGVSYPLEGENEAVNGTELAAMYGYEEPEITQYWWYRVDDSEAFVSFDEECIHNLTFFAKDNVCNHGPIYERTYYVDEFAPTLSVKHPDEGFIEIDNDSYIKCDASILINATDDGQCDAGVESIFWRYEFDDEKFPPEQAGQGVVSGPELVALYGDDYLIPSIYDFYWYRVDDDTVDIRFYENCTHDLYYFAKDNVCHPTCVMNQTYYVDCAAPETNKTFDGPVCAANESDITMFNLQTDDEINNFWLRDNSTWVILQSYDKEEPCVSGVDYIYAKLELSTDEGQSWSTIFEKIIEDDQEGDVDSDPGEVRYEFKIMEDCLHKITWYAVDLLGNVEEIHVQYHRVDSQPPESEKTFEGPTYGEDNYWVTSDTEITLTAIDMLEPCDVGVVGFHVKIEWDQNCDGSYITIFDDDISDPYTITFTFKEMVDNYGSYDCYEGMYIITWGAYDCLGNIEETKVQHHQVDDTGPHVVILKPVDGWYSDGECIPAVVFSEDIPNPHCGQWQCGSVGIEDGKQGYAYLIDIFPEFSIVELDSTNFLYDADSHEFIGNICIPEESGLADGIVIFVAGVEDNLGNDWDSIREMIHAIVIQALAECMDESCCMQLIADLWVDFVIDQNLVFVGIDNTPPEVHILEATLEIGTIYLEVNATDVLTGIKSETPMYVTIGGVTIGTLPYNSSIGGCEGTLPTAGVPDGEQTLTVSVADRAGCMGSDSIQIYVPNLPGPTTSGTDVNPDPAIIGEDTPVVTATTFSTIAEVVDAEYFIDTIGNDGEGTPLYPVDGVWDGTTEDITATIDTTGLHGLYTIYVHGKDADGRWGAYDEEEFSVLYESEIRDIELIITYPNNGDEFEVSCDQKYVRVKVDARYDDDYNYEEVDELDVTIWVPTPTQSGTIYRQYYEVFYDEGGHYFYADIDFYKYSSGSHVTVYARAEDEIGNEPKEQNVYFIVLNSISYSRWFEEGWNGPVNLAVQGCDDFIESVFASIDPYYDFVFEVGTWDNYWHNQEDEWLNGGTLQVIDPEGWYWVHMTEPARFYIDNNCPEVTIEYPDDEETFYSECLEEDIWGYACDIETSVTEVTLVIYDNDTGLYWDGSAWVVEETLLPCIYDDETKIWYYDETDDIDYTYISGHTIILTATATDMVGCSCSDTIWYMFIDDSDPIISISYPVDEETYDDCIEPTEIYGIAYDDECETIVTDVFIQLCDETTGKHWDGDSWEDTSTDLTCTYDPMSEDWSYDGTLPEWQDGHEYTVYARATDAAGNTGEDEIVFYYICEEPETYDFGDAPDSYGTLLASIGARHIIVPGLNLGPMVDTEPDGQPSPGADGDDLDLIYPSMGDDEDGVTLPPVLTAGDPAATVIVDGGPSGGMLDAWIDFNGNGVFDHPAEQIFASVPVGPGPNPPLPFAVPIGAIPGVTYARFRLSITGGLPPTGPAPDGEVEDYVVTIEELPCEPTWTVTKETWCYDSEMWFMYGYAEYLTNTAQFRIILENTGSCAITDPEIIDQLPLDFVYNSDNIIAPAGVSLDTFYEDTSTNYLYWNFTGVLQPGEQIEIVFWADYIGDSTPYAYYTNWALGGPAGMVKIIHDSGVYVNWWITE